MNSPNAVERVNSVLMVAACAAAFVAPFHVFLAAYAVLGPLHYLTQISWLHDRQYFAPRPAARRWWLVLVGVAIAVMLYGYVSNDLLKRPVAPTLEIAMVYLVFVTAALLLYVRHVVSAVALIGVAVAVLALFSSARAYALLAYFIITIVHVLLFTAAFVLHGALKRRSGSALMSLGVFAACIAAFFLIPAPSALGASPRIREVYGFFTPLNEQLIALFGLEGSVFDSAAGLAVMRLIAFAYTYHYLNWFSKTSIIRWHQVTRRRAVLIFAAWGGAVALYVFDYATGLSVLYTLSVLHVLLEFPLDHQTFAGIGTELRALVRTT
ncbi:MAG TPA: hypothetical protein VGQ36_17565 [Thermoanaerobaculia bacterium]|jgi:hypothetical protein|nr:hypothetical protein [Thermoanaerobaculia bacterium]